ncbi:DUF1611 domain-containing protein [Bremerella sp. JC770]|uniref:DUF1611 domain-containing protein n=1 Tax=Bremerella sp. JC770 TaxID=3232137 RepID=UPI003458B8E1
MPRITYDSTLEFPTLLPDRNTHPMKLTVNPKSHAEQKLLRIQSHRRIIIMTDGFSSPFLAKTAMSLIRYRGDHVTAVLETAADGENAADVFGVGETIPLISSLLEAPDADAVYVGIAPPGGKLPGDWRDLLKQAIRRRLDIVSGLHDFLMDDPELVALAQEHGAQLIDVRRNQYRDIADAKPFRQDCIRIHTVGQDCALGKMVTTLEVEHGLSRRGESAAFVATGQTGIMVSGRGVPIDCVVSDFVNGTIEHHIRQVEDHDFLLIEGQGSIGHPAYSSVTAGLLHGSAPHGLIYCYEAGRTHVGGIEHFPLHSHQDLIRTYETLANVRHPCRVIGVAVNTRNLTEEQAYAELAQARETLGLPVCDVYRTGAGPLVDAAMKLRQEVLSR